MPPVRILLADDHALVRASLKALLAETPEFLVVAEAATGEEVLAAVEREELDVVLLDLSMPTMSGLEAARRLRGRHPRLPIVAMTMHDEPYYIQRAFEAGIEAYVLKQSAHELLLRAIHTVVAGEEFLDPAVVGKIMNEATCDDQCAACLSQLTERERTVCAALAFGHTRAEIAANLSISESTVDTHRRKLMKKLKLKGRAALVRFAIESGLLGGD